MTTTVETSWRYVVIGAYKDRDKKIIRIYPLPFLRISVTYGQRLTPADLA